jgi:hypothetical protein
MSLNFGIFRSTCGPMRKCHVAVRTTMWQTIQYMEDMWKSVQDVASTVEVMSAW